MFLVLYGAPWIAMIARRSLGHVYVCSGIEFSFDGDVGTSIACEGLTVHPSILACLIRMSSVSWAYVNQICTSVIYVNREASD